MDAFHSLRRDLAHGEAEHDAQHAARLRTTGRGPDPLGIMEPVICAAASAIAVAAALLAGLPAARRATTVQPMVAIRTE